MPTPPGQYRVPCDNCGASLRFHPGQDALHCDYCGHNQPVPRGAVGAPARGAGGGPAGEGMLLDEVGTGRALQWDAGRKSPELEEIPLEKGLHLDQTSPVVIEQRSVSCPNCGARFEIGPDRHAERCPFCATPVVVDTGAARRLKPQGVVPFVLTQEQAHTAMEDWLGRLWFAPSGLKAYAKRGRKMTGVYSPFWTFDATTRSEYTGQRGDWYYETVYVTQTVNGRTQRVPRQVRRTRWRSASGRVGRAFNDVLVLASASLPRQFTDALTPWDLSHLTAYRPDFLLGFEAEGYTIPLAEAHETARAEMADVIAMDARRDIGGDEQRLTSLHTEHSDETFKHILLPVWTAAYKYNGKSYRFVVNGQTGRVAGERPYSAWKIALAVLAALLVLGAFFLFSQGGGMVGYGGMSSGYRSISPGGGSGVVIFR